MYTKKNHTVMIVGGCFDLLHLGHIDFLSKAKQKSDYLIVLLEPDEKVREMKGEKRPINNETIRIKNLEKTGLADKSILLPTLRTSEDYQKFIQRIIVSLLHYFIAEKKYNQDNQCNPFRENPAFPIRENPIIYFGITKNDRNTKKNKNIQNLGKKMKIEVLEVNKLMPDYSTSKLIGK